MQPSEIERLTAHVTQWHDNLTWTDELGVIAAAAIAELAGGEPVEVARLAARAGMPAAEAQALLRRSPAEFDEQERLVGLGLSLWPTPHRLELGGRALYTWCAGDTLMFPVLLDIPARVQSPCAATGQIVRIDVDPDRVRRVDPDAAVVSMVTPDVGLSDFRRRLCDQQHYFASAEVAAGWLAERPEAIVLPVADAFTVLRALTLHWFGHPAAQ